ncbi:uncharacterized protein LOC109837667 [Asparagus officinalis]|uniref:uncharacterized protein LOC109837667 n=1 Tax=Asparagus officinalis TaxID=4686 RepID=UPI00098E5AA7|nr:uncharacterized protein LOC109837667 [Asparagus officinalis]
MFKVLRDGQLKLNRKKYEIGKEELVYLSFIVGKGQRGTDPSKYRKLVEYHSKIFMGAIQSYPTYDKEFYVLYQAIKHWRVYLLGKQVVLHSDHKLLEFLHVQTELQQARHMKLMSYLMAFNIVIRYKKGTTNKLADMLSRPPMRALLVTMLIQPLMPLEYVYMYTSSRDFSSVFEQVKAGRKGEYELGADGLLYHGISICIPEDGDRL